MSAPPGRRTGRIVVVGLLGFAALAGAGLFWLEQFHWYDVTEEAAGTVLLTRPDGTEEPVEVANLRIAEGASSPLKYRACFRVAAAPGALTERFAPYPQPAPTVAPLSFPCFDADAIAAALDRGEAVALLGAANVVYGIDRVVALAPDGTATAWHQLNVCGARLYDGLPPPDGCPPPPPPPEG